ncbi:hypothetical protein NMY22_g9982 [Coprinellus aureogranulatus]|nr:hypothetical protein NMY22_g9982 [Coprinellus aureogranulatus]
MSSSNFADARVEESVVEDLLLAHTKAHTAKASQKPTHRHGWRQSLYLKLRLYLIYLGLFWLALTLLCHAIHAIWQVMFLPSMCRQPGMEVYSYTRHCRRSSRSQGLHPELDPDVFPLDGTPPTPVHLADFEALGDLQVRMAEHFLNISVSTNSTPLELLAAEFEDEELALSRLQKGEALRGYSLRETVQDGLRLATDLRAHANATVALLVRSHRQVEEGVEWSFDNQPQTIRGNLLASVFPSPRPRKFIWAWETDMEMKWQFYNSLLSFKGNLQRGALQLSELLGNITKYGEQLASLRRVISQWDEEEEDGDAAPLVGWSDTTGSDDSGEDEGHSSEEALVVLVDKLAEDTQAATDRVGSALQALQVISEEVEELRRKVAKPVDPPPFFTHLHGMYITGARLGGVQSEICAFAKAHARGETKKDRV